MHNAKKNDIEISNWLCYCGEVNPEDRQFCVCGASPIAAFQFIFKTFSPKKDWECQYCMQFNRVDYRFCDGCGRASSKVLRLADKIQCVQHMFLSGDGWNDVSNFLIPGFSLRLRVKSSIYWREHLSRIVTGNQFVEHLIVTALSDPHTKKEYHDGLPKVIVLEFDEVSVKGTLASKRIIGASAILDEFLTFSTENIYPDLKKLCKVARERGILNTVKVVITYGSDSRLWARANIYDDQGHSQNFTCIETTRNGVLSELIYKMQLDMLIA